MPPEITTILTSKIYLAQLLPFVSFGFVWMTLLALHKPQAHHGRIAFLQAAIIFSLLITFTTELLSLFKLIRPDVIFGIWLVTGIVAIYFWWKFSRRNLGYYFALCPRLTKEQIVYAGFLIGAVLTLGVIVLWRVPNTIDAMTYHLGRVVHWMANQSLRAYPTPIIRQLYSNPFAEFVMLHLQILGAGSDRLAGVVQFFSMVGSLVSVSLIAAYLGVSRKGQMIAAVLVATLPMGIFQATNVKNDYVLAFFLTTAVVFLFQWLRGSKTVWPIIYFASALGLSVLTKATAYFFIAPFIVWFVISQFKNISKKSMLLRMGLVALIGLSINFGNYARTYQTFGQVIFTPRSNLVNQDLSLANLVLNFSKSMSLQAAIPYQPFNDAFYKGLEQFAQLLGRELNDPAVNYSVFDRVPWCFHEEAGGNPFHFYFLLLCLMVMGFKRKQFSWQQNIYCLCVLTATVLLTSKVSFHIWHPRLHLPLFVLAMPVCVVVMELLFSKRVNQGIIILAMVLSVPYLFNNPSAKLLGERNVFTMPRLDQLFMHSPGYKYTQTKAVEDILAHDCHQVGLVFEWDSWEYPYWALFKNEKADVRIEHIKGDLNPSTFNVDYPLGDFKPCALIETIDDRDQKHYPLTVEYNNEQFVLFKEYSHALLYFKEDVSEDVLKQVFSSQFREIVEIEKQIVRLRQNKINGLLSAPDVAAMIALHKKQLAIVRDIPAEKVNLMLNEKDFLSLYQENLAGGLELIIEGMENKQAEKYFLGRQKISLWFQWLGARENLFADSDGGF